MLEDRVLHLERSTAGVGTIAGDEHMSGHARADGRKLPIVRLDAPAHDARDIGPAAVREPPARVPSPGKTLVREPAPDPVEEWTPPSEVDAVAASSPEHTGGGSMEPKAYRLVGSRLVELTRAGPPKVDDPVPRGTKAKGVVAKYDAAMAVYKAGALDDAEQAFEAFARAHPRHDYADNALYWKGEAAYDQAHFADALAAFTEVVERYGGGNKAADALLKIGLCYRELGDHDNARDVLTQLIDAYPGESASDIARVKLAEFGI